ncbi:nucleotidyltransferase family protein [Sulfuricella sp.]|uniref:nucleotidyltransferase family protein n=1 Tax=Sulfuricella sp. TaxID=2099377 RepID=UPI002CB897DA|nr:nucleotidyltransferase family protein [Sulfuricella sp.]HUX64850.1 nucleotidyltransferase family protein [Sulfuricella sp.]
MIVGILLAAGSGTRFGGDKLLFPLPEGTPIGVKAARNLLSGVDRGVAVVRPSDRRLADLLEREGLQVAFCPDAEAGMGTSLAFGVSAAQDADGCLIALADMPFIQSGTIRGVAGLLRAGAQIAAPQHQGRRGHPVGFAHGFFHDLAQLNGDRGARAVLAAHAARIQVLECEDRGIFTDIDTRDMGIMSLGKAVNHRDTEAQS